MKIYKVKCKGKIWKVQKFLNCKIIKIKSKEFSYRKIFKKSGDQFLKTTSNFEKFFKKH